MTDTKMYPIDAVIAYRRARHIGSRQMWRSLTVWCEMAAVPADIGRKLAEPYKHHSLCTPLPDDPLVKLSVLVLQMREEARKAGDRQDYWLDSIRSAEEMKDKGCVELPLVSETFETWTGRKPTRIPEYL